MFTKVDQQERGEVNMKFFAELDSDNKVINIIQTEDSETTASCLEKQFQGPNGVKFVEASNQKNAAFRVRMAQVGGAYNEASDRFEDAQPYASWTQDDTGEWQAPEPKPTDEQSADRHKVMWAEDLQKWVSPTAADMQAAHEHFNNTGENTVVTNYYWDSATSTWVELPK